MAKKKIEIERLDFEGLEYYDEKLKEWVKKQPASEGVTWGKIKSNTPYFLRNIQGGEGEILIDKNWFTDNIAKCTSTEGYYKGYEFYLNDNFKKLKDFVRKELDIQADSKYLHYSICDSIPSGVGTNCIFLDLKDYNNTIYYNPALLNNLKYEDNYIVLKIIFALD